MNTRSRATRWLAYSGRNLGTAVLMIAVAVISFVAVFTGGMQLARAIFK